MNHHLEPRQPAQLPVGITKNSPTNGDLEGVPPTTFDGDRSKADGFITEFGLFHIINEGNPVIKNPKRRVALALTYIRGPTVDAWVSQQYDALLIKANHAPTHADTNEALWEDFIAEFKRTFAEPSWKVIAKLETLRMAGDDVEMFIANFENLMRRAEYKRESVSMVHYFRQCLPTYLLRSIMKREAIPNTIDEWQSAARMEVKKRALMEKLCYLAGFEGGDTDAVQTGVTRLTRLSEEERARLMKEGRCFECNGKGHRARDCPDKLEGEI
jgi:hypothetical protein